MVKRTTSQLAGNSNREAAQSSSDREIVRGGPPGWAVAVILAFLIGAVYGPSINVPFVFDDRDTIMGNDSILKLWPLIGRDEPGPLNPQPEFPTSGRPVINLSFALNYYFGGFSPVGYHAVNIVIHFLSAMLVWAILTRTLRLPYFGERFEQSAGWLALAIAMLWALHPLQTEAVVYVTQRTELMMALFYLATLYCSLRYWSQFSRPVRQGTGGNALVKKPILQFRIIWLILAVLACAAGMASKEVMVSAPVMVLLFERTFIVGSFKE